MALSGEFQQFEKDAEKDVSEVKAAAEDAATVKAEAKATEKDADQVAADVAGMTKEEFLKLRDELHRMWHVV